MSAGARIRPFTGERVRDPGRDLPGLVDESFTALAGLTG
jgi:hypothetical protein